MKKPLIGFGIALALSGIVYAGTTIKPFRMSGGAQMVPTPAWNGPDGGGGLYYKQDMGIAFHSVNGVDSVLGAGGGGVTFPLANGTSTTSLNYAGTMTGSSTAYSMDSTNAYTTGDVALNIKSAGTSALKIGFNFGAAFPEIQSQTTNLLMLNSTGDGFAAQGANTTYVYGAGAPQIQVIANNGMTPVPGGMYNGTTANPWSSVVATAVTSFAGTGTATGNCPVTLYENTTVTPSVTTGETAGSTYSIPANTLSAVGQKMRISAGWTHAANTNSTTYKLYFNGTAFINVASAVSGDSIFTDFEVVRTTAGYSWHNFTASGAGVTGGHGTSTATFTSAIDTHISVTGATTNGDLSTNYMRVEWWP